MLLDDGFEFPFLQFLKYFQNVFHVVDEEPMHSKNWTTLIPYLKIEAKNTTFTLHLLVAFSSRTKSTNCQIVLLFTLLLRGLSKI